MINKFFKKPSNILKIFVFIFVFVSCFSLFTQTIYAQAETDASGAPVYSAGVTTAAYDTSVKVADIPDKTLSSTGSKPSGAVCDISALALITDTGTAIYCGFAKLYVNIITFIPNLIAAIVGILNDIVINLSIGYGAYSTFQDKTFTAWKIIRDFSNIIIILSLFVAAFSLILGGGDGDAPEALQKFGDPKKIVVNVVIVALFINFSFFFSRVIIDAGNVTARFLYNQIGVDGDIGNDGGLAINIVKQATNTKQISIAMLSQVQPQTLLSTDEAKTEIAGGDTITAYLAVAHLTLLFDVVLIYIFSIMLFLFMGRIVMLNLLTILSPLAFASYPIPFLRKQEFIGLDSWIKEIVGNSFLATIFLFFIYLSVLFSKIDITGGTGGAGLSGFATGFLLTVVGMLFKVALMFGVIFKGKTLALKMAGTMGQYVSQAAGWATGIAAGAATGGTALLARQTLGAAGAGLNNSNTLANMQARGGFWGGAAGLLRSGGNRLGAASFDVRNSPSMMGRLNRATNAIGGGDLFDPKKGIMGNKFQNEGGFNKERRNFSIKGVLDGSVYQNTKSKIQDHFEEKAAKAEEARIAALKLGPDHPLTIAKERADAAAAHEERRFKNSDANIKNEKNIDETKKAEAELKKANENEHIQAFDKVVAELNTTMNTLAANEKAMKGFTDQINKHDETINKATTDKTTTEKDIDDLDKKIASGYKTIGQREVLNPDGTPKKTMTGKVITEDYEIEDTEAKARDEAALAAAKARKDKLDAEIATAKAAKDKIENDEKYKYRKEENDKLNTKAAELRDKKAKALETDSDYDKANKTRNAAKEKHKEAARLEKAYREDKDGDYYKGEQTVKATKKEVDMRNDAILQTENIRYEKSVDSLSGNAGILSRATETITGGNMAAGSGTMGNQGRQARRAAIERAIRNNNNNMRT